MVPKATKHDLCHFAAWAILEVLRNVFSGLVICQDTAQSSHFPTSAGCSGPANHITQARLVVRDHGRT